MIPPPSILRQTAKGSTQKLGEIQYYLASRHVPTLAISESRFRPATRLHTYVHYQGDSPSPAQLPSASLFVHKSFHQAPEHGSHFSTDVAQFVACTVSVNSRALSLTIVSVLRPYLRLTEHFDAKIMYALHQRFPGSLIVCGDFNAHHLSWGSTRTNSRETALAEAVHSTERMNLIAFVSTFSSLFMIAEYGEPSSYGIFQHQIDKRFVGLQFRQWGRLI